MLSDNNGISNGDWILRRIHQLHERMRRTDYRGYDPFDLPNSPLFRIISPKWKAPQLLISKFGSRIAPIALRKMLGVPRTEDPKIYACAYFGYKFLDDKTLLPNAEKMLDGIIGIGRENESGISWGYDFTWPTLSDGVNPRGASTIVPASFAMLALIHETVTSGSDKYLPYIGKALKFYGERHVRRNSSGIFLGYFTHSTINTHNANLLGCAALSLGARLTDDEKLLRIAADATHTSLLAVDDNGYIEYNDGPSGKWTDSFHHLYVIAALRAIAWANPLVDAARCNDAIERMWRYYTKTFLRDDGQINYYPGTIYPIDSHNYAATSIFYTLFGGEFHVDRGEAENVVQLADSLTWDDARGYYLHRIHKNRKDTREFLRWNQAWMFLALCMAKNPDAVHMQLPAYNEIVTRHNAEA
jgi:hypothetical protein